MLPNIEIEIEKLRSLLTGDLDFHNQASNYASHNFHSFPAKFPPQLPRKFIQELTVEGDVVLDPMVGSGTTAVETYLLNRRAVGFDIDPLALHITKVKTTTFDKNQIMNALRTIINNASKYSASHASEALDEIKIKFDVESRNFIDMWFLPKTQIELISLLREINNLHDYDIQDFFKVAFSAIIITKSGGVSLALDLGHTRPHLAKKVLDKNGNVIYGSSDDNLPHYLTKIVRSAIQEFEKKCLQNLEGIHSVCNDHIPTIIKYGDAQSLPLEPDSIDLIVTSPPYASNAIDYMRAHKFSLVWFGFPISDLGNKRKEYIGGEAISGFEFENLPYYPRSIVDKIYDIDKKKSTVVLRYYSEMTRVLREMFRVLKPGKTAIVVVGNSLIRGIDVEIPYCLSEIGKSLDFKVPVIGVRQLDRNKRMLPAGLDINLSSQIQQRMHEEYVIGFLKP